MSTTLNLAGLVKYILGIADTLIPVLIGLALVAFFIGLIRYVYDADSSTAHTQGRYLIGWGLVAMFVLVCVWGIVVFISVAFLGSAPGQ
jgi:hypothetical protein